MMVTFECFVFRYDTYHDSTRRGESVGALVASVNDTFTRWGMGIHSHLVELRYA